MTDKIGDAIEFRCKFSWLFRTFISFFL